METASLAVLPDFRSDPDWIAALRARFAAIYEATDRVKATGRCCDQAARRSCVCRLSVECPDHGVICIGSHD